MNGQPFKVHVIAEGESAIACGPAGKANEAAFMGYEPGTLLAHKPKYDETKRCVEFRFSYWPSGWNSAAGANGTQRMADLSPYWVGDFLEFWPSAETEMEPVA